MKQIIALTLGVAVAAGGYVAGRATAPQGYILLGSNSVLNNATVENCRVEALTSDVTIVNSNFR